MNYAICNLASYSMNGFLYLIDQAKTFDRANHKYLFTRIKAYSDLVTRRFWQSRNMMNSPRKLKKKWLSLGMMMMMNEAVPSPLWRRGVC